MSEDVQTHHDIDPLAFGLPRVTDIATAATKLRVRLGLAGIDVEELPELECVDVSLREMEAE